MNLDNGIEVGGADKCYGWEPAEKIETDVASWN